MRRLFAVAVLGIAALCSVFSASLAFFDMDHPVYDEMDALFLIEGKAAPLGSRPWTEIDVQHMLDSVDPVTAVGSVLWDRISGYIVRMDKNVKGEFGVSFSPRLFVHTNPDDFSDTMDIYDPDLLNDPLADIGFGLRYKENIAARMEFSLGFNFSDAGLVPSPEDLRPAPGDDCRYRKAFGTNIPVASEGSVSMNFPNRTYLAFGFDAFRAVIGRDRLSWGNGLMGNMMLGDTLPYHDYLSLTFTGSEIFSYQMIMSFFTHTGNLMDAAGDSDRNPMDGLRFFLGHRFEFSLFSGKLRLAVNESIMYQSASGYFDFRVLNPLMFLHDLYIAGNSNSLMTFEIDYSPIRNLSLYAQAAIDDLAVGEAKPGEAGGSPDGWGVQAGVRFTLPKETGDYFFGNVEFVYTSPYIYHRAMDDGGLDLCYISTSRIAWNGAKSISRYLSFPFGSDAIAADIRFGYRDIDRFMVEGNAFFMAHGVIDKFSKVAKYNGGETVQVTPSNVNPFDGNDNGPVEYTFAIGGDGSFNITDFLSLEAGAYGFFVWNKDNRKAPCVFDLQIAVGMTLEY